MTDTERTETGSLQKAAEAVLTDAWGGGPVRLDTPELLRKPGYRNQIVRFVVADAPTGSPATIIVKTAQGTPEAQFDPENDTTESPAWRFYNEWAGNRFLNGIQTLSPLNAQIYGGNASAGIIVLEDLGKPSSLADAMQDTDSARLHDALLRYAKGLGQLHAVTMGREAELWQFRTFAGGKIAAHEPKGAAWLRDEVVTFRKQADALGVVVSAAWNDEAAQVAALLDAPGPFSAFLPGDTCPDNHRLMENGSLRFFDFEFAGFGHALLDAAYLCMPFPTCWCVNRLPEAITDELISAYRAELAAACPEARDDKKFAFGLAAACAFWMVCTLAWGAKEAIEKDDEWGISTTRQRIPFRLNNFAQFAEKAQAFPAMTETVRVLAEKFRTLWPDTEEMPLYPAFRDK